MEEENELYKIRKEAGNIWDKIYNKLPSQRKNRTGKIKDSVLMYIELKYISTKDEYWSRVYTFVQKHY